MSLKETCTTNTDWLKAFLSAASPQVAVSYSTLRHRTGTLIARPWKPYLGTISSNPLNSSIGLYWNGAWLNIRSSSHNSSSVAARSIALDSHSTENGQFTTHAKCTLTTSYVEVQVACDGKNCAVQAIRRSVLPHNSSTISSLDSPVIEDQFFFGAFINSTGVAHPDSPTPLEYYFLQPDLPYSLLEIESPPIYPIGKVAFAQRFAQLLNTYYIIGIGPNAITGNFSANANSSNVGFYQSQATTSTLQTRRTVLKCNRGWLTVLVFTSLVMLLLGLTGTVLGVMRRGPDVLDTFALAVRHNRLLSATLMD